MRWLGQRRRTETLDLKRIGVGRVDSLSPWHVSSEQILAHCREHKQHTVGAVSADFDLVGQFHVRVVNHFWDCATCKH